MQAGLSAALASAAVLICATAAPAQTTTAPTSAPVVGPTAVPTSAPVTGGATSPSTYVPMPAPTGPAGMRTMPLPAGGSLALDARYLRGTRTAGGYRLTGQAQVKDACTGARFSQFLGNIFPPQFNLVQYRRPGTLGLLCAQHLVWVAAQTLNVTSAAPPRYVTVRTAKGTTRVPILPGPVN
ncbi:MAG: hypothetical protein JWM87_54 [Candidatus Eremiobacteraeota bacterium]|nr:hypothetical protein [Candidatus Eremiobacteraeota bacterium]